MTQEKRKERKIPPFPRLAGRLHIFPALIPMVEILPWLLTAVGALAGATQLAFWRRHRRTLLVFALLCFLGAGGTVIWANMQRPSEVEGSRLVAAASLPKLTTLAGVPGNSDPADRRYEEFKPLWSVNTKNEPLATPVVAGGVILIGTFESTIDARARTTGELLWSLKKREPIFTNPAVTAKAGFVGEGLHTAPAAALTAFSLPDGKPLWERQFRSHVESAAMLDEAEGRLFTPAGEEGIWALRMKDGAVLWRSKVGHTDATPLLLDGRLYVSAQPHEKQTGTEVSALDPDDGEAEWKLALPGNTMGSPQAGPGDILLVSTAIGQVGPQQPGDRGWSHAVTREGKLLWTVELPGLPLPEAAILQDKGFVIHTLKTGEIVALNVKGGSQAWAVKAGRAFDAPAALLGDTVPPLLASITTNGVVSIMNAEDGTEIRRLGMKKGGYAAPVFDNDILYVTTPHSITAYGGVHLLTRGKKN